MFSKSRSCDGDVTDSLFSLLMIESSFRLVLWTEVICRERDDDVDGPGWGRTNIHKDITLFWVFSLSLSPTNKLYTHTHIYYSKHTWYSSISHVV